VETSPRSPAADGHPSIPCGAMAVRSLVATLCLLWAPAPGHGGPLDEDLCAGRAEGACGAPELGLGLLQTRAGEQRQRPARQAHQSKGSLIQQRALGSVTARLASALGEELNTLFGGPKPRPAAALGKLLNPPLAPPANCSAEPWRCGAPLHCDANPPKLSDFQQWMWKVAPDGRANVRFWCSTEDHSSDLVKECIVNHDLKKSAQVTYDVQVADDLGEVDGSYCFIEGYCNDKTVTYNTTLEEMEQICNERYPDWTSVGLKDLQVSTWSALGLMDGTRGIRSADVSHFYAKLACAMGNYHCDAIYCQQEYCGKSEFRLRFGLERPARLRKLHRTHYPPSH